MITQLDKTPRQTFDGRLPGGMAIRLLDASPCDVAQVRGQLGLAEANEDVEPDLVLRFSGPLLAPDAPRRFLGQDDVAFTERDFCVLRRGRRAAARIAFDTLGERCELVCESGSGRVPLLLPIVNLTALSRGLLPLHASAFTWNGQGALVTGWARGGKTTALLGFMARGARFVSDDWVYVDVDGRHMYGLAKPVEVADRQLREFPRYLATLDSGQRWRMGAARLAESAVSRVAGGRLGRRLMPAALADKLVPALRRRRSTEIAPGRLFGDVGTAAARIDKLFFSISHDAPEVIVRPADPDRLASQLALLMEQEYAELKAEYLKFRFAFPARSNPLLDETERVVRERLSRLFEQTPAFTIQHPYPVSAHALYESLAPLL